MKSRLPLLKAKGRKRALLVEGGGMKGAFAGGVLHSLNCLLPAQYFDTVIAVSSGACCAAYYASTPQPEPELGDHTLSVWRHELAGRKLISPLHPFQGKTFLDQEYLIDYLFREKYPLQKQNFEKFDLPEFRVAVTNLKERSIEYVRATESNIFDLLKAATALPIATRGRHRVDGTLYSDAALLNPLPLQDLVQAGYTDITVVMNSPVWRVSKPFGSFTRLLSFPKDRTMGKLMSFWHHYHFNLGRSMAQEPPDGVTIHTIAPNTSLPVGLVSTKQPALEKTVSMGLSAGVEAVENIRRCFGEKQQKKTIRKLNKNQINSKVSAVSV